MSQYFIDKLVYNNDTLDIHDTEAREMINTNTTNIQALSARVTQNANDIDALENTTDELRDDVDSLDDRMGVAETEIDGLKIRATNLEGRMTAAEGRLDDHDDDIEDLQDRMDTAENNIIALDGRMTAAENDIDAAEHRLDLVEAKNDEQDIAIDDLEENVAQNTADIVDIKDDLTGIHEDIEDLDDRITASTYEAGIGIYFGQGVEHTNINVEDEILDQINQNTIDIQNLKTRVTNVENRLTVVEGDITDIKAEIVNIKADITALDVRVTALEQKALPTGGRAKQVLMKNSATDFDVSWEDIRIPEYSWSRDDTFELPPETQFFGAINNITNSNFWRSTGLSTLVPTSLLQFTGLQSNDEVVFLKTEHFSVCWINYQGGITLQFEFLGGLWNLASIDGIKAGDVEITSNGLTYTQPNDRTIVIIRALADMLSLTGNAPDLKAILHVTYDNGSDGYVELNNSHKWSAMQGDFYYFTGMFSKIDLSATYVCKIEMSGTLSPYTVTFNSATL